MQGSIIVWAAVVAAIAALSLWWTTVKARRILGQSLGRKLREDEETSLESWMQASDVALDSAAQKLERNPFDRFLRILATLGIWQGDIGTPPGDRTLRK